MFDPQHLEGASSDLVRSMFQVGRKAAELERQKLQMEIQKDKSELRGKKLEKWVKMSGKAGGRSGSAKNPKKIKPKEEQEEDDDLLDDLVVEKDMEKMTDKLFHSGTRRIRDERCGQEDTIGPKTGENCSCDRETR